MAKKDGITIVPNLFVILFCLLASVQGTRAEGLCDAIILGNGYPCTEYTVQTQDGFLLGLQNIPHGIAGPQAALGKPMLLQHGILEGGDDWVLNNPQQSLAYIAADAGYDVWIGSSRTATWSHGHISLLRSDSDFWDWTWDDLAAYDTPAFISFIYARRNTPIYYVGHSQGTITALAAFSQDTSLTDNIAAAALLSPIAFLGNVQSTLARIAADMYIDQLSNNGGPEEFGVNTDAGRTLLEQVCATQGVDCGDLLTAVTGPNCCFNDSRWDYYLQFEPQSTSTKNLVHLAQMIRTGTFAKHDYGLAGNLARYGSSSPPAYNLGAVPENLPILLGCGGQDWLADTDDVGLLRQGLNRNVQVVDLPNYAHVDFITGTTANSDIYDPILAFFQSH